MNTGFYIVKAKMDIGNSYRVNLNNNTKTLLEGWEKECESIVAVIKEKEYFPPEFQVNESERRTVHRVVKLGSPIEGSMIVYNKEHFEYFFEIIAPK